MQNSGFGAKNIANTDMRRIRHPKYSVFKIYGFVKIVIVQCDPYIVAGFAENHEH